MPQRMGIRELRDTLTATVRRVREGETIEITHHGLPVATLAPIRGDRVARLHQAPDITPPSRPLELPLQRFKSTTGITASEALEEDRAER